MVSRDLFLSILAMDAYNRDFNLKPGVTAPNGTAGDAEITDEGKTEEALRDRVAKK